MKVLPRAAQEQACGSGELVEALWRSEGRGREFSYYTVKRCELASVLTEEGSELVDLAVFGGVGVEADGPEAFAARDGRPELHGNPLQAAAGVGHAGETVGEVENSLVAEGLEGVAVEAVAGRYPQSGFEAVTAKDVEPLGDEPGLLIHGEAGEFCVFVEREQAFSGCRADVAEAVKGDGASGGLEVAHFRPETGVGRRGFEVRIAIVWDDGEDGLDSEVLNEGAQALPAVRVDGGTEVVDAEEVLRGLGWRGHDVGACAEARRRRAAIQRKRQVLTVQSEVDRAMPATPMERMRRRLSATSRTRLRAPQ